MEKKHDLLFFVCSEFSLHYIHNFIVDRFQKICFHTFSQQATRWAFHLKWLYPSSQYSKSKWDLQCSVFWLSIAMCRSDCSTHLNLGAFSFFGYHFPVGLILNIVLYFSILFGVGWSWWPQFDRSKADAGESCRIQLRSNGSDSYR